MGAQLADRWMTALSLTGRREPDLYRPDTPIAGVPHAAAMRLAFQELELAAIHCVQGVPTVAFLVLEEEEPARVDRVHAALWSQGLMSLLLVVMGDQLRAYTLTRKPLDPGGRDQLEGRRDGRLLETLRLLDDALVLRDLISGVESGRLFRDRYPDVLDPRERVDGVLLRNLKESRRRLSAEGLDSGAAQALLMQVMFIAYLEDRGIVTADYFRDAMCLPEIDGLRGLLNSCRPELLQRLFIPLHEHFNGDLFHSPCAFGTDSSYCPLKSAHMRILADFIWGEVEMDSGQRRLWSYQFRYIPVELISAVYDHMLADDAGKKKSDGAFYTPMFLADLVVDQAWELLGTANRRNPEVLDPACGSGVFLVRLFERLVEYRSGERVGRLPWHTLKALVGRLHGWDKNPMAVRIAVFSLYLALLEQRQPREIRQLMAEGKLLPPLWGKTFVATDFFSQSPRRRFDLVIGNPPWNSRRHKLAEAIEWCNRHGFPIPQEQSSWGFVWKAREHARENGLIALLLPAMGFFHNDAALSARRRWLHESRMERIINFADLRHLLFDNAKAACSLALYRPTRDEGIDYRFDYWCPKADLNIQTRRLLTLSYADRRRLSLSETLLEADLFKNRLWMGLAEAKLHDYLSSFSRLNQFVVRFRDVPKSERGRLDGRWVIGQGFAAANPERVDEPGYFTTECPVVTRIPFLGADLFKPWVLPRVETKPWPTAKVHRERFSQGFTGPHILISQVVRLGGRLRAAYDDQDVSFFHSIQAVKFPPGDEVKAKLLTAVLNSRLVGWFLLHETGAVGIEIPKVHEDELLSAPFPEPDEMDDPERARQARKEIVSIMDGLLARRGSLLEEDHGVSTAKRLDELVFAYFGLDEKEIAIVEETFDEIVPAIQPNKGKRPALWSESTSRDHERYLGELVEGLGGWMKPETRISAEVLASSEDAAIVRVWLGEAASPAVTGEEWAAILDRLWVKLDRQVSRNLQVLTGLRVFDGDELYLFKPRKRRFWLRTTAMNDAAAIAAELLSEGGD